MKLARRANMIYFNFKTDGAFTILKWLVTAVNIHINKHYKCSKKERMFLVLKNK